MVSTPQRLDLAAVAELMGLADYSVAIALRAVSDIGVADHLTEGARPVAELAAATGTDATALRRTLRVLCDKGVFDEVEPGCYGLTATGQLLRGDHPFSLRDACRLVPADVQAWARFDVCLTTGQPAFDQVHGQDYWGYLADHPEDSRRFDASQESATRLAVLSALRSYKWSGLETVVDLGGGNGAFIAGILRRHKRVHGILVDLPHVVAGAGEVLAAAGVQERCRVIGASFFDTVPAGADAYVLNRVLYGWDDEHVVELLKRVRAAMTVRSRLLVMEPLSQEGTADASTSMDLLMMVLSSGRARTPEEFGPLLAAADLALIRVLPSMLFPIIEAGPV